MTPGATALTRMPLDLDVEHLPAPDIDETAPYDLLTQLEFQHLLPGDYGLCIFQGIFPLSVLNSSTRLW